MGASLVSRLVVVAGGAGGLAVLAAGVSWWGEAEWAEADHLGCLWREAGSKSKRAEAPECSLEARFCYSASWDPKSPAVGPPE